MFHLLPNELIFIIIEELKSTDLKNFARFLIKDRDNIQFLSLIHYYIYLYSDSKILKIDFGSFSQILEFKRIGRINFLKFDAFTFKLNWPDIIISKEILPYIHQPNNEIENLIVINNQTKNEEEYAILVVTKGGSIIIKPINRCKSIYSELVISGQSITYIV